MYCNTMGFIRLFAYLSEQKARAGIAAGSGARKWIPPPIIVTPEGIVRF
jgi:hypothetical protein